MDVPSIPHSHPVVNSLRISHRNEISEHEYTSYMAEWEESGETIIPRSSSRNGRTFAQMQQKWSEGETDKAYEVGFVPNSLFFLTTRDGRILGSLSYRRVLNEKLRSNGGHIGYGIRPSERRKGYATWFLSRFLTSEPVRHLDKVLVTCDEDNLASRHTIEACGGRLGDKLEWEGVWTRRYWIDIPPSSQAEWESQKEGMIAFMVDTLRPMDIEATKSMPTLFRKRSEHTLRVLAWARRLVAEYPSVDSQAVEIAAIFHDIGYATCTSAKAHARESAVVCRRYLLDKGFEESRVEKITQLVEAHSRKDLMNDPQVSTELSVLMEADLLDETGAMGILWDSLVQGQKPQQSYRDTYQHIRDYTKAGMENNPLRSRLGRAIWEEKKQLVGAFLQSLETDLSIGGTL